MHCSRGERERPHHERDRAVFAGDVVALAAELDGVLVAGEREHLDVGARARLEGPLAQVRSRIDRVRVIEHAPQRALIGLPS